MTPRWKQWREPSDSRRPVSRTRGRSSGPRRPLPISKCSWARRKPSATPTRTAIAKTENDWFALQSSRAQLQLLSSLGFRPDPVQAGIAVFDRALGKLKTPEGDWQPRQVILFSGHMVDAPARATRDFPRTRKRSPHRAFARRSMRVGAGPEDLALCQAAAGGDLLFLEACQQRNVRCQVLLPLREPEFIDSSILPSAGGEAWRARYFKLKPQLQSVRVMPDELGPLPSGVDAFERCNLWLLYTTLSWGIAQGAVHLSLERWRWRWAGRHPAYVQRGEDANRPCHLARHAKAVDGVTGHRRAAVFLVGLAAAAGTVSGAPQAPADRPALRQQFLEMFARSYFPGRSGQLLIVAARRRCHHEGRRGLRVHARLAVEL